jgi:hypothetical protein
MGAPGDGEAGSIALGEAGLLCVPARGGEGLFWLEVRPKAIPTSPPSSRQEGQARADQLDLRRRQLGNTDFGRQLLIEI